MKKIVRGIAVVVALASLSPLCAKEIKRKIKPASGWVLYLPGKNNSKDVMKDLNKSGWQVSNSYEEHFSFVDSNINGKKCLKFQTLDGKQDAIVLPLSGKEKRVTLIFKAKGSFDPDAGTTPYGIFYAYVQNGSWQTLLRHNSSNQVKGVFDMSRMRVPGGPGDFVDGWHDYRLVFENTDSPENMTSKCYIDGKLVHSDKAKDRKDWSGNLIPDVDTTKLDWNIMGGCGNYLEFGDNDGSTNAFGRYAYLLTVIDDDVSSMSLEEMGKKLGADLVTNPVTSNDPAPASKRPAKKPAYINITKEEVNSKEDPFYDRSAIKDGKLRLTKLPYSRAKAEVITDSPVLPDLKYAAVVDLSGKDGAFKTIKEAIDSVPSGSAIKILPGLYYEKLKITKPGITLVGEDPSSTIIYGFEADTGGIDGNLLVEVNYLPAGADSVGDKVKIPSEPGENCYFNAANITFYNKGAEWNKKWGSSERRSIALALKGVDKCYLKNCIFLGQQDTLYWRSGRIYAEDCYIEGDVDFICGGATALFQNCKIYTLDLYGGGIIVAAAGADTGYASTSQYASGFVFRDCKISGSLGYKDAANKVTLGRGTWIGGSATFETAVGRTVYLNCTMDNMFKTEPWSNWDSVNTWEKAFFREFGSKGEGASAQNRPQLTQEEYEKYYSTTEKILGYTPEFK